MEKNTYPTFKPENATVCEKLRRVIQTTSPFRAIRFGSNNQVHDETPSANVSLMTHTPLSDHCTRIPKQSNSKQTGRGFDVSHNPIPVSDRCPRRPVDNKKEPDQSVPIIFRQSEDHSNGSGRRTNQVNASVFPTQSNEYKPTSQTNKPKASFLPIHGLEHRVPTMSHIGEKSSIAESINVLFTEYIDRAGRKIRSPTMEGGTNMNVDSFNDKVSDFIDHAKNKFHSAPSLVDSSFKEKGLK